MIEELRQRLRGLERPPGLEDGPAALPLGAIAVDRVLGGGLMRGARPLFPTFMFSICSSVAKAADGVKPQAAAVLYRDQTPALGLMGEEDDEGRGGQDAGQPEQSGIGAVLVHGSGTFKGCASNPYPALRFSRPIRAACVRAPSA